MRFFFPFLALPAAAAGLFQPVSELEPELLMPPDSEKIEIAPDGNFLVEGRPRYLLGTIIYDEPSSDWTVPGPGYEPENAWIYETIPDRDYLQRLGFDTVGGGVSKTWMQAFRPEKSFWQGRRQVDWSLAERYWKSGLPTIVDFTCARWTHGGMRFAEGRKPSAAAIPPGGAGHFMPYSLVTPEGRDLYARMWRAGAEELRDHGVHPYAYELFNEPTVDDRSPESRAAFAAFLSDRFEGDAAAMDAAWGASYGSFEAAAAFKHPNEFAGLGVEWLKFREATFASGIRLGLETICAVDPDARVCFQPLGIAFGYVNILEANRDCGVVMSPTGGRNLFDTMLLRAVAKGKPIIDGETYYGHTRASHRAMVLTQWSRGFDASYYFMWDRRLWDPLLKGPDGPARLAETFPWLALNPACTPTEALAGLLDAKREIAAMQGLFGPREHGLPTPRRAAFLHSHPTERLGIATGGANHPFTRACALSLTQNAHLPLDAVFEEQLAEGTLEGRRFLVAAGIDAVAPGTREAVLDWVEDGGTLVLAQEAMQRDEYGRPHPACTNLALGAPCKGEAQAFSFRGIEAEAVPYREVSFATNAAWEVLAALPDGHPAVARRAHGKGSVYYVGVRFPEPGAEARILASIAADADILPTCSTSDPATGAPVDGVEAQAALGADGAVGFVVANRGLAPRAVRFRPGKDFTAAAFVDLARRVILRPDADGAFLLRLEPDVPVVLRGGEEAELPAETYEDALAAVPAWLAEHAPKRSAKAFRLDPARVRCLDLRDVANRSYADSVAGDGKGGWTDQGENHLRHAPWGVTDCNGVPFDFIRPDQNDERAVVILRSTHQPDLPEAVRGIQANLRAEALYFLHACAWTTPGEAFRYVVHYADGTEAVAPMHVGKEVGDWWIDTRRDDLPSSADFVRGWTNSENRGFHVVRWENPHPEKTIATIDIESACGGAAPIIEGITAELLSDSPFAPHRVKMQGWGGAEPVRRDGGVELVLSDASLDWAGASLRAKTSLPLPDEPDSWDLVFEVNGGRTPLGRVGSGASPIQISVECPLPDGSAPHGPYITPTIEGGAVDGDPWSWQTARIPLRRLLPKSTDPATGVSGIVLQYKVLPADRTSVIARDFRFKKSPAK